MPLVHRYGIKVDNYAYVHYISVLEPMTRVEKDNEIRRFCTKNKMRSYGLEVVLIEKLTTQQFEEKYNEKDEPEI